MQSQKDLLFYSNLCNQCKEVMQLINKRDLRNHFLLIPVDNPKFKIPHIIRAVPTILLANKQVLVDNYVVMYIEKIYASLQNSLQEITPFTIGSSQYSSQYTYLTPDGNGYDNDGQILNQDKAQNNNFILLNDNQSINAPVDNELDNKSNKFDSSIYEKYISSRNNDDESIKKVLDSEGGRMPIVR
jgi:hypothetical protein